MKIYRYFSHKSDILYITSYITRKTLRHLDLLNIASEALQANTYSGLYCDLENDRHKKISTFLERGSQSSYIVNSLAKRNNFAK